MALRSVAWLVLVAFLLAPPVIGDEPPKNGEPSKDGEKPKDKEAPKDGEKPKEGEPGKDEGAKEGEKGKDAKTDQPGVGEEPDEPKEPAPAGEGPPVPPLVLPTPPFPGPGGMLWAPATGRATVGTGPEEIQKFSHGRNEETRLNVLFEHPQHAVEIAGLFFDPFELTNAQYDVFLKATAATTYDTTSGAHPNLVLIAGYLLGTEKDTIEKDNISWRKIYEKNRAQLWEKMADHVVKKADGEVDEEKTAEKFKYAPLARGIVLQAYRRRPPDDWPSMEPNEKELNRPVRWVSYIDAEAYADWAGKHVLTEDEWEWISRGPEARLRPWGDVWEKKPTPQGAWPRYCNWGGFIFDDKTFLPVTVDVDDPRMAAGRSWCGAWNMIGNVAEWTSTWFNLYPKNTIAAAKHANMGQYVRVVKGGSLNEQDEVVLRCAYRNFTGRGIEAPPRPNNRFEYVGFRCGWYPQPGRDQAVVLRERVKKGTGVKDDVQFAMDRLGGAVVNQFLPSGASPVNGILVLGRAMSVVVLPLSGIFRSDDKQKNPKSLSSLLSLSEEDDIGSNPLPLAVLQTDVALDGVWVKPPEVPGAEKPKPGGRRRKTEAPALVKGTCKPGTYLIALMDRKLVLVSTTLDWVCTLVNADVEKDKKLELKTVKEDVPLTSTQFKLRAEDDLILVRFGVPLQYVGTGTAADAKEKADGKMFVSLPALAFKSQAGALKAAGEWRVDTPEIQRLEDEQGAAPPKEPVDPPKQPIAPPKEPAAPPK